MTVAMFVVVGIGFGPSIVNPATRTAPVTPLVAIHGAVYGAWLLVFLAQTTLVATRRVAAHRRLGTAAMLLVPIMVVLGYMTAIAMGRRGFDLSGDIHVKGDPLLGMVNPLGDLLLFIVLVAAAYALRRRSETHKRLMLLATIGGLMPAPLAHLIGHLFDPRMAPLILVPLIPFLFASAVYDRLSRGRIHPVSLWGALAILLFFLLLNGLIGPSATWHRVALWAIQ
jgi:hypothetical protein